MTNFVDYGNKFATIYWIKKKTYIKALFGKAISGHFGHSKWKKWVK